jgi:hypothetical protein
MNDGVQLKYGQISGGDAHMYGILVAAMNVVNASGKFVYRTGASTDTVTLAVDGTTEILGHLECEAIASAVGTEKRKIICDLTAVFRIPVNSGTFSHYMIGKKCDISVSSTIQGAQLDAATEGTLIVVGGDDVNNKWVDVMINPAKVGATGVA